MYIVLLRNAPIGCTLGSWTIITLNAVPGNDSVWDFLNLNCPWSKLSFRTLSNRIPLFHHRMTNSQFRCYGRICVIPNPSGDLDSIFVLTVFLEDFCLRTQAKIMHAILETVYSMWQRTCKENNMEGWINGINGTLIITETALSVSLAPGWSMR